MIRNYQKICYWKMTGPIVTKSKVHVQVRRTSVIIEKNRSVGKPRKGIGKIRRHWVTSK